MGFGGPHAAYIATRDEFKRSMPGRLVGVSDRRARRAGLSPRAADPRAAHPPREGDRATSAPRRCCRRSIASMYAVYHGPDGLRRIAGRVASYTAILAAALRAAGYALGHDTLRHAATSTTGARTDAIVAARARRRLNLRRDGPTALGITLDETTTRADVDAAARLFAAHAPPATAAAPVDCARAATGVDCAAAARPAAHSRVPDAPGVQPPPQRDPSCCATCAAWPTRTWRSTAR